MLRASHACNWRIPKGYKYHVFVHPSCRAPYEHLDGPVCIPVVQFGEGTKTGRQAGRQANNNMRDQGVLCEWKDDNQWNFTDNTRTYTHSHKLQQHMKFLSVHQLLDNESTHQWDKVQTITDWSNKDNISRSHQCHPLLQFHFRLGAFLELDRSWPLSVDLVHKSAHF